MFRELSDTSYERIKECINGQIYRPSIGPINNASTVTNCKLISHVPSTHNSQCSEYSFAILFTIH